MGNNLCKYTKTTADESESPRGRRKRLNPMRWLRKRVFGRKVGPEPIYDNADDGCICKDGCICVKCIGPCVEDTYMPAGPVPRPSTAPSEVSLTESLEDEDDLDYYSSSDSDADDSQHYDYGVCRERADTPLPGAVSSLADPSTAFLRNQPTEDGVEDELYEYEYEVEQVPLRVPAPHLYALPDRAIVSYPPTQCYRFRQLEGTSCELPMGSFRPCHAYHCRSLPPRFTEHYKTAAIAVRQFVVPQDVQIELIKRESGILPGLSINKQGFFSVKMLRLYVPAKVVRKKIDRSRLL